MAFVRLNDEEWAFLKMALPEKLFKPQRGYPRSDFRKVLNAIFWVLDSGSKWAQIPATEDYATKSSAHRWMKQWQEDGTWEQLTQHQLAAANLGKKVRHLHCYG